MSRLEEGIPALYRYQAVKYHHVTVEPGANLILTSDPWSYIYAWLSKKKERTRGHGRACFARAIYYARLAESFYKAEQSSDLPAKGTLLYYGMLNLVKCFLSIKGILLGKDVEHHGLSLSKDVSRTIDVLKQDDIISVFGKFAAQMGTPVLAKEPLDLASICLQIPEIHEMSNNMGVGGGSQRYFLPIEIDILVNKNKDHVFTEIRYEKKHEERVDTTKFLRGARQEYFRPPEVRDNWVISRSKRKKRITHRKATWVAVYKNILNEYSKFDISSILTRSGYRYYCNLRPGKYHSMCYPLALMFYLGSVARYRPAETEKLLSGELRPVIGEATTMIPTQFLYQMVSHSTNSICVLPMAMLK